MFFEPGGRPGPRDLVRGMGTFDYYWVRGSVKGRYQRRGTNIFDPTITAYAALLIGLWLDRKRNFPATYGL
jgi:hypothetical protein